MSNLIQRFSAAWAFISQYAGPQGNLFDPKEFKKDDSRKEGTRNWRDLQTKVFLGNPTVRAPAGGAIDLRTNKTAKPGQFISKPKFGAGQMALGLQDDEEFSYRKASTERLRSMASKGDPKAAEALNERMQLETPQEPPAKAIKGQGGQMMMELGDTQAAAPKRLPMPPQQAAKPRPQQPQARPMQKGLDFTKPEAQKKLTDHLADLEFDPAGGGFKLPPMKAEQPKPVTDSRPVNKTVNPAQSVKQTGQEHSKQEGMLFPDDQIYPRPVDANVSQKAVDAMRRERAFQEAKKANQIVDANKTIKMQPSNQPQSSALLSDEDRANLPDDLKGILTAFPSQADKLREIANKNKQKAEQQSLQTPETKPVPDSHMEVYKMADRYEKWAQQSEGGTGLAVGSGNIEHRWKTDALRGMMRDINKGMTPEEAAEKAKQTAKSWINQHNQRRSDSNWQRWDGAIDHTINNALTMLKRNKTSEPSAQQIVEQARQQGKNLFAFAKEHGITGTDPKMREIVKWADNNPVKPEPPSPGRQRAMEKRQQAESKQTTPIDFDGLKAAEAAAGITPAKSRHDAALDRAASFRKHGEQYDRTISDRARRLEIARESGHDDKMLDHLAGELTMSIDALEQRMAERGIGSKADPGGLKAAESAAGIEPAKAKPKTYEQMKAEVEEINAKHGKGTGESSKAYGAWLQGLSKEDAREYIDKDAKERRFARRSKAGKRGHETKLRKNAKRDEIMQDPAGKIMQEHQDKIDSLMRQWQSASPSRMKEIDQEVDQLEKVRDLANKHFRLRENHRMKDTKPHELDRNRRLPKLGSEENKQATSGDRDESLIPWKVSYPAANGGKNEYVIAGADLRDGDVTKQRVIHLRSADGTDAVRNGLLLHFDPGDQEKNKRARQLVWAINHGQAQDATFEELQDFVHGDSLDHSHREYAKTPRGAGEAAKQNPIDPNHEKTVSEFIAKNPGATIQDLSKATGLATHQYGEKENPRDKPMNALLRKMSDEGKLIAKASRMGTLSYHPPEDSQTPADPDGLKAAEMEAGLTSDIEPIKDASGNVPIDQKELDSLNQVAKEAGLEPAQPTISEFASFNPEKHGDYRALINLSQRINDGEITHDEFKAAHKLYHENQEAFQADLKKRYNAKEMQNIAGNFGNWDAKRDGKDKNAEHIYNRLLRHVFNIGDGISNSYSMKEIGDKDSTRKRIAEHVAKQTPESLAEHVAKSKKSKEEVQEEKAAKAQTLADPKTLDDYRKLITDVGGWKHMKPEHQDAFDDLYARDRREQDKARKATVQVNVGTDHGGFELTKNFHSKRGTDIFTASPKNRVDRDEYDKMNSAAKKLGGWYYKQFGSTPGGFHFPSEENRNKFLEAMTGKAVDRSDILDEKAGAKAETTASRLHDVANRMEESAESVINADRKTNTARRAGMAASAIAEANRQKAHAQTLRRIAEHIDAGNSVHLSGVKAGTHIDELNKALSIAKYTRFQKMTPEEQQSHRGGSNTAYEAFKEKPLDEEDVRHVEYPFPSIWTQELRDISGSLKDEPGFKKLAVSIGKLGSIEPEAKKQGNGIKFDKAETFDPAQFAKEVGGGSVINRVIPEGHHVRVHSSTDRALTSKHGAGPFYTADAGKTWSTSAKAAIVASINKQTEAGKSLFSGGVKLDSTKPVEDRRIPIKNAEFIDTMAKAASKLKNSPYPRLKSVGNNIADRLESYKRMQAADIQNTHELRAALREYLPLKQNAEKEDPVKKAERQLVGRKFEGFFPTPRSIIDQMLDHADIQQGHSVLEPSAGKGDILDAILDRHKEDNVQSHAIEIQPALRNILELKGHSIIDNDFTQHAGKYDRIVMNPPFEKGQDMEHVRKAHSMLKPGGKLVAIMAGGGTGKREEFDQWVWDQGGEVIPLESGSFSGDDAFRKTGVNTKMVVIPQTESSQKYSVPPALVDRFAFAFLHQRFEPLTRQANPLR